MDRVAGNLQTMVPALLFLLAGVPLAALLDRLGFFDAVVTELERRWAGIPVAALWVLSAVTTAVLNLDTTIVLLTPLAIRLARRCGADPLALAAIPLVLAGLASSFLPVSNLTTLIAAERLDLGASDVVAHLAAPSLVACTVGWFAARGRLPARLAAAEPRAADARALAVGAAVVAGLLAGFVAGPLVGIEPWAVALAADLVLVAVTRWVPWRDVPVATALGVAALGAAVTVAVPSDVLAGPLTASSPLAVAGVVLLGAASADAVNNLPAVLVALPAADARSWGTWAWLLGVNAGAALVPVGALANLLWWRIARDEGVEITLRRYVATTVPVVLPALLAAAAVLAAQAAW